MEEMDGLQHACPYTDCKMVFSRPSRLLCHIRTHTGERPYLCAYEGCSKSYTRTAHLKRHMESHRKRNHGTCNKVFRCDTDDCHLTFTSKHNLDKHKNRFHEKYYTCNFEGCGNVFKKHQLLTTHSAEHSGTNPFKCTHDGCSKTFASRQHLKRHVKAHEGYTCTETGCDRMFDKWTLLRKHVAIDHKPVFSCEQCNKTFTRKEWLRIHVKTHSETRSLFNCPYESCPRTYFDMRNLTAHTRSYHEGKKFTCNHEGCGMSFVNKQKLQNHIKLHDPNRPMPKKKTKKSSRKIDLAVRLSGYSNTTKNITGPHIRDYTDDKQVFSSSTSDGITASDTNDRNIPLEH